MAWKDDPKAFWKYMTGEVPPADPNKFLKWGYQNNGLLRPRAWYGRMFIMVISGNIIRKLHTEDEVQAAGIDQVVGRIIGATSAKGQRYRLAVTKYHKFVTALGVGAAFCGKISDKAYVFTAKKGQNINGLYRERIGSRDLDEVLERCKEEKLYDQFLRKYEKIAFNIIQCVGLD